MDNVCMNIEDILGVEMIGSLCLSISEEKSIHERILRSFDELTVLVNDEREEEVYSTLFFLGVQAERLQNISKLLVDSVGLYLEEMKTNGKDV